MTVQTVPPASDALMLLAGAGVAGLLLAALVQVAKGRGRPAARVAALAAAVVMLYCGVLVGVGLASRPPQLTPGDVKCFDDWCAAMVAARPDAAAGTWVVDLQLQNRGRGRAMRSNLGRAYLEAPGGGEIAPVDGAALRTLLQPGERVDVPLLFRAAGGTRGLRLVVTEAALGPGTLEIGGEGSPFHARAGWPLAPR